MKYWFKPIRFWKWFAAYYPATWEGWFVTLIISSFGIGTFLFIDRQSPSIYHTLTVFAPFAMAKMLVLDLVSLRVGEYPEWWRKHVVMSRLHRENGSK